VRLTGRRSRHRSLSSHTIVRFAVIGSGAIADVHARAIRSLPDAAALSLIVSTREASAHRLAEARGAGARLGSWPSTAANGL
jgi:predicted dehydrogenase